ncbi:helix-turn-helix domain-containing protein [Vibrio cholerae]|nr:helix-turn-helix domain-containing protein [Vibrio cholerae]
MEGVQLVGVLDDRFAELPENLTIEQLADVLGVKRATAYQWLNRGVVPAYKLGGTWIIFRDEVRDHLVKSRNVQSAPDVSTEIPADKSAQSTAESAADEPVKAPSEPEHDPQ